MSRRFVNLVTASYRTRMYALHRLDVSMHLFYPSTAEAEAAAYTDADNNRNGGKPPRIKKLRRLPEPSMRLQPYLQYGGMWSPGDMFSLMSPRVGDGEADRILHTSEDGHAILCDVADSCFTKTMPSLNLPKGWDPISITVPGGGHVGVGEERLYVMSSDGPLLNLEVLHLGHGSPEYKLQPPPGPPRHFGLHRPQHFGRGHREFKWQPLPPIAGNKYLRIMSSTLLDDGRIICVSATTPYSKEDDAAGTYCFDTERYEWWRAGDWLLPFDGRAVHVPELDTWLGFSPRKPYYLCAADLNAVVMAPHQAPKVTHVWDDLNRRFPTVRHTTKEWQPMGYHLVNLGSGRFCIAKIFQVDKRDEDSDEEDTKIVDEFAVLTGVEVVRGGHGGLRMVKHKSKRYMFTSDCIKWVL